MYLFLTQRAALVKSPFVITGGGVRVLLEVGAEPL